MGCILSLNHRLAADADHQDWFPEPEPLYKVVSSMGAHDLIVIGAGPGGYVAAIRAAQLGMKVALAEREEIGGVCLNWGCVPSKALLRNAEVLSLIQHADRFGIRVEGITADYSQAVDRSRKVVERVTRGVQGLLKKNKIEVVSGSARLLDHRTVAVGDRRLEAPHIILATGARAKTIPGFEIDGELVVTYREGIVQRNVPPRVVIIGGGAMGVEFASIYNAYGADVTMVELMPQVLPNEDAEISRHLTRALERQGIHIYTGAKVSRLQRNGADSATVEVETAEGPKALPAERIVVAVGIQSNTEELGLEKAGVTVERGSVRVDKTLSANGDGMFAVGDVTGIMPLAHVAQAQGVYVAERLAGEEPAPLDYQAMPRAVYCNPQVASFGLTEQEAKAQGLEYKVGRYPFTANAKALALGETEGMAKVIVEAHTGELLGGHLIGHEVTEMLGELSLARVMEGTNLEVGAVVNAHPTISETIKEAALAADGRAIHL